MGEAQGELNSWMTPCLFNFFMASFSSCARAMGTCRGGCFTGGASPVGISWAARCVQPKSVSSFEKISEKCLSMLKMTCLSAGVFPSVAVSYNSCKCSGIPELAELIHWIPEVPWLSACLNLSPCVMSMVWVAILVSVPDRLCTLCWFAQALSPLRWHTQWPFCVPHRYRAFDLRFLVQQLSLS